MDFTESVFRNPLRTAVQQTDTIMRVFKSFCAFPDLVDIILSTKPWSKWVKF